MKIYLLPLLFAFTAPVNADDFSEQLSNYLQATANTRWSQSREVVVQNLAAVDDTLAVVERNRARVVRWNFENRYWLDFQTGFAWKSVQHFVPGVNPIDIEITKPAAAQA